MHYAWLITISKVTMARTSDMGYTRWSEHDELAGMVTEMMIPDDSRRQCELWLLVRDIECMQIWGVTWYCLVWIRYPLQSLR